MPGTVHVMSFMVIGNSAASIVVRLFEGRLHGALEGIFSLQASVANVNLMRLCMHMQVRDQENANRPRAFQRERLTMHEDQIICRSM